MKENAIEWKPTTIVNLKDRDDLLSYHGSMGNNGVDDFNRNWINAPSSDIHPGFCYRFFYPLSRYVLNCCSKRKK